MQDFNEKERVLLLWKRALTLFYENDTELFVVGAQERTIAGKIAMHMYKIYQEFFPMPGLTIDIEYNRSGANKKPNYLSTKETSWTAPDIILHKRTNDDYNVFCCEMKKNSKPGKWDATKVRSLIYHRHYKFGVDLYEINENIAKMTVYYLKDGCKRCQKEEYLFKRKTNQIEPLKV